MVNRQDVNMKSVGFFQAIREDVAEYCSSAMIIPGKMFDYLHLTPKAPVDKEDSLCITVKPDPYTGDWNGEFAVFNPEQNEINPLLLFVVMDSINKRGEIEEISVKLGGY